MPQWRASDTARSSKTSSLPAQPISDRPAGQPDTVPTGKLICGANGYSHPAVKVFMKRDGTTVEHKYTEHYPPDTTAAIFFLKNRRPDRWRDVQNIEAQHGLYIISERPLTEEEWIKAHASNAADLDLEASPALPKTE